MMSFRLVKSYFPRYVSFHSSAENTSPGGRLKSLLDCVGYHRHYSVALDKSVKTKLRYDAVIIGAGHNGLICAAYLQKAGLDVCVLERRHLIGGAAVTEEIVPGFKFSRASYLLSLLRPQVFKDLELKKHGLKIYLRDPNSFTPLITPQNGMKGLLLGSDGNKNAAEIAQFSTKDAEAFVQYEHHLSRIVSTLDPLLDSPPVHIDSWVSGSLKQKLRNIPALKALIKAGKSLGSETSAFYELMTAPASKVLDRWFESEPLKATLATDSVIGAMTSPHLPGSGYVLLHHVMGELEGVKGAWAYVQGGMGAVSEACASAARVHGASIFTDKSVAKIIVNAGKCAEGVVLEDGTEIKAKAVLSNATPRVTFLDLVNKQDLQEDFIKEVEQIDFTSPVTKINVAVNSLPNFLASPNVESNKPLPHHYTTIHLNCEHTDLIHEAYQDAMNGGFSKKPVIEMTIPSSLDPTLVPPGCHVVQLFTQYTPYTLSGGQQWDEQTKNQYADTVFDDIEKYAPGFKASVIGRDILTPPDMERIFGLTGGNIFHGSMSLDQLYMSRPLPAYSDYRSPIQGLYLCGSGAHPGGGVMGAPGRLAAQTLLKDMKK